ncbi:DUF2478 domain-containing protein [Phaeovulum sp.]|uniref:DUF2478 domain-containing protein n=1 Tax=Phaeovulum sp. TaxID=2934796 RepID=UPI003568DFD4
MTRTPLAAVRFEAEDIDTLLAAIAAELAEAGWRLAGVIQSRGETDGDCDCAAMNLTSLATSEVFCISQNLGRDSEGCRLHLGELAKCAKALEADLAQTPDLLVLSRFGRGEIEGGGFRDLIAHALAAGIPVLTGLHQNNTEAWAAFCGEFGCDLPFAKDAALDWARA